jgi:hypothetical protein
MNYYGGKQLAESFRTVRQNTIQTAQDIPEEQYGFAAADGAMTIGAMLAHLAASTNFHYTVHGVDKKTHLSMEDFGGYMGQAKQIESALTTKAAVIDALTTRGEQFAAFLDAITDAELAEFVSFPPGLQPPSKSRFEMLLGANAPPRPADGDAEDARHHAAPHPSASGSGGGARGGGGASRSRAGALVTSRLPGVLSRRGRRSRHVVASAPPHDGAPPSPPVPAASARRAARPCADWRPAGGDGVRGSPSRDG